MTRRLRGVVLATGAVAAAVAVAGALGAAAWGRATARLVERLERVERGSGGEGFRPERLASLPAPVARYFRFALTPGQPPVHGARLEHRGEFRTAPEAAWSPFRSVQHVSAEPPGFVWDARIAMAPLLGVRVRDAYVAGRAEMRGRVAALLPVVDQAGTPHLAAGALHRYLAESVWLPTALLPREGLTWHAVDDSTARVTLTDSGVTVSLDAHFGPSGEIVRVEAQRYRDVDGEGVLTPFVGHLREYAEVEGMRIPTEGEVEWILPGGPFAYWRARLVRAEYRFRAVSGAGSER